MRLRRIELDDSTLGWRLGRCWDCSRMGHRKHDGSRQRSMTPLEMVSRGFRIQRTQLTVLGISKLGRKKLSGSRLGRREVDALVASSLGGQYLVTGWAAAATGWAFAHPVNMLAEALCWHFTLPHVQTQGK